LNKFDDELVIDLWIYELETSNLYLKNTAVMAYFARFSELAFIPSIA